MRSITVSRIKTVCTQILQLLSAWSCPNAMTVHIKFIVLNATQKVIHIFVCFNDSL